MAATRSDVARAAGVSPAVVSYVLNDGPRGVAPATRRRVLDAIDRLNYRPNRVASSLRSQRTMSVGLIVPDNTNPYFAELARCVEDAAFERGFTLLLANSAGDVDRERSQLHELLDRCVDGLFFIPSHHQVPALDEILASSTRFAVLDRWIDDDRIGLQILSDNAEGGRLATEHLLGHGRRRIACIAGPESMGNAQERVRGWREALETDDPAELGPVARIPISRFSAREAMLGLLREDHEIDALFVASDEQAIGVLRALRETGLDCPTDVAVASFDGTSYAALTTPGLTTVQQPIEQIARRAMAALFDAPEGAAETGGGDNARCLSGASVGAPGSGSPLVDRLPVSLVTRGSCGCPDVFEDATSPVKQGAAR